MIHIARDARLYTGEGAIDFSPINDLFPNAPLSIELPNAKRLAELGPEHHARTCLEAARAVFEKQERVFAVSPSAELSHSFAP